MSKEITETINDISIADYVKEIHRRRSEILEEFAKAYLAETKLMPSEVELVSQEVRNGNIIETVYKFRRKESE